MKLADVALRTGRQPNRVQLALDGLVLRELIFHGLFQSNRRVTYVLQGDGS